MKRYIYFLLICFSFSQPEVNSNLREEFYQQKIDKQNIAKCVNEKIKIAYDMEDNEYKLNHNYDIPIVYINRGIELWGGNCKLIRRVIYGAKYSHYNCEELTYFFEEGYGPVAYCLVDNRIGIRRYELDFNKINHFLDQEHKLIE